MSTNIEDFISEQWRQPEKKYAFLISLAIAGLSIAFGGLGFSASLLAIGASGIVGYLLVPLFRFVNQFGQKLNNNMDHLDELLVKAKSELEGIDKIKQEIEKTASEANKTLAKARKKTLPKITDAISNLHQKTLPKIEEAIEEVKSALPEVKKTVQDVHKTVQHANDGADMISKIMTPVTGTVNLISKAGTYVGFGQKQKEASEPTTLRSKQKPIKAAPQRRSARHKAPTEQTVAKSFTPMLKGQKKSTPKDKKTVALQPAPTVEAQPSFWGKYKFW
ncbi:MAG: hypothetical protein JSR17_08500 [Proteobacteria bacterium]|nr:hypothetical protein [Pseudomonadota bacterium]